MNKIDHSYFGALNTDAISHDYADVVWHKEFSLTRDNVQAKLWATSDKPMDAHRLDAFASRLKHLSELDMTARQQIGRYLEADRDFIEFHLIEIPEQIPHHDWSFIKTLMPFGDVTTVNIADFVLAMRLQNISLYVCQPDLWLSDGVEEYTIVMDYVFSPEVSDQILAVKFTETGEFVTVSWES
ncbi:DUF2004 domain-containing protein [Acinetobacter colistiniresistens]|uniref:DUF2004 domain-containing protein n=1 Tax=Acinetobacter colistiniresistens TaxID=280145 RepID=UPI00211BD22C|nr:DUF2004 domain-containing protein [Acinetobacter colistiniresistens]UUM26964.1 DUF2004 domain-containing protein [Acinetobacter colistiniresistens]